MDDSTRLQQAASILVSLSGDRRAVVPERVPCQICQHDIPSDEALGFEATDYVVYFCGLDCYQQWRDQFGKVQNPSAARIGSNSPQTSDGRNGS